MDSSSTMDTTINGVPTLEPLTASLPLSKARSNKDPAPPLERMPMYTMPKGNSFLLRT
eukprot:CAMPEP_0114676646 /NCGR_PEP_ID=MMETSP0191-20121206/49506_1 /TAXON_ID=126664 /ORGANISM="Sorites sp." /LENGTH=57 /DNA_ID=CAMNT_0001947977 /DNA_START=1 /DNA_END=174 /DNA_ORIENTATION=+